jgi:hypothetical protein
MSETKAVSELSIIPRWAWILAALVFAACLAVWGFFFATVPMQEPESRFMPLVFLAAALFGGALVAAFVLLTGYVNRDAPRRGMGAALWTTLVLVIPNGIGLIVYFLVRQPLRAPCPKCSQAIPAGSTYCPACGAKVAKTCPHCDRGLKESTAHCPHCGQALAA